MNWTVQEIKLLGTKPMQQPPITPSGMVTISDSLKPSQKRDKAALPVLVILPGPRPSRKNQHVVAQATVK